MRSHKLDKTILGENQGMTNAADIFWMVYELAAKETLQRDRILKARCL